MGDARQFMLSHIGTTGLTAEDAAKCQFKPLSCERTYQRCNHKSLSYLIPYFAFDGTKIGSYWRVRFAKELKRFGRSKAIRYKGPRGEAPRLYMPPYFDWEHVRNDPSIPILIVEGERKAALFCKMGYRCVALGGVQMFRSKKRKIRLIRELVALA